MSRKILSIFALPSHTYVDRVSGVDFVRIIQPMRYLDGWKDKDVEFKVTVYDHAKNSSFDWRDVFKANDCIYFNYTSNDIGYAIMGLLAQKFERKLVCDYDDDLFSIAPNNPAYEAFKKGSWGLQVIKAISKDVSHLTVTNRHLKNTMAYNTDKTLEQIEVLPNLIDLDLYKHRCEYKDRGYYVGLHFGSSTHFSDLYSEPFVRAMTKIMYEYPNFTFRTVGAFVPKFRELWGVRYEQGFGDTDLMKWIEMMPKEMDKADFMLVPLVNTHYNRSKSGIKFLEASSYKIPGIYQRINQYQDLIEHGKNGLLATTEQEWYEAMVTMLTNSKLRKSMGEEAFKTAQANTIQGNIKLYADFFKRLLLTSKK